MTKVRSAFEEDRRELILRDDEQFEAYKSNVKRTTLRKEMMETVTKRTKKEIKTIKRSVRSQ